MPPKKEINMQIGERIKEARLSAGATQERLAEKINVSVQYVSDLERGKVGTSIPTLIKICRALHTSSDFLLFGKKDESEELQAAESLLCSLNDEQLKIVEQAIQITLKALEYESDEKKSALHQQGLFWSVKKPPAEADGLERGFIF